MRKLLRDNGLSIALLGFFALLLVGQAISGHRLHNEERAERGASPRTLPEYLASGAFLQATMENWESEFLQMFMFLLLTAVLFQKGSAESKDPDGGKEAVDRDPRRVKWRRDLPGPVRRGGVALWIYERSLSIAFLVLFLASFVLHAYGGACDENEERAFRGEASLSMAKFMGTSRFWFESFQNWQSEFLSIAAMVILSIYLRQRGSPESKPVDAAHAATGK